MKRLFLHTLILLLMIGNFRVAGTLPIRFDDIKPEAMIQSSVTLKANLYFSDQDEKMLAIAGVEVYLLDKDLPAILKDAGMKLELENKGQCWLKKKII